jgi:Prohead core protein serine protease
MDNRILLNEYDCYGFQIDLNESNLNTGKLKFRGKLQESETKNKNNRVYPHSVLDENVQRLQESVKSKGLIGELDHPQDSIIHFKEASHVITKLWWEGHVLMGEGEILTTSHGRQLRALLNDGIRIGMSSRGIGNGKPDSNGVLIIGEGYKLITFDAVADPSTPAAFQERIISNKREGYGYDNNYYHSSGKNNTSRIYNTNKEALIATIGGVIKEHTDKYKRSK